MDWTSILSYLGGSLAFFGAAAWLARSLVQHLLSKDVESYRTQLKFQHESAIERLKSDVQMLVKQHEIRFGHLHAKRAEIIEELYQLTVETNSAAESCIDAFREKGDKRRFDLAKELVDRGDELAEFVIRNKIYFSVTLAHDLEELYTCLIDLGLTYRMHCAALRDGDDCSSFRSEVSSLETDISGVLRSIEEEFRALLGVEEPKLT